jgi:hypothetical protein
MKRTPAEIAKAKKNAAFFCRDTKVSESADCHGLPVLLWPLLYLSGFMRILRSVFPAPQGTGEKRLYSVKDRQKKSRLRLEQFRRDGLLLQIL